MIKGEDRGAERTFGEIERVVDGDGDVERWGDDAGGRGREARGRARRRGRKTWMIILGRRRHRVAENDQSRSPRR